MTPRIVSAEYIKGFRIRIRFEDGREAEVDFKDELWGEVFEPLKDPQIFRTFRLDEELNTLRWSTGADFAPEFLYDCVAANKVTQPTTLHVAADHQQRQADCDAAGCGSVRPSGSQGPGSAHREPHGRSIVGNKERGTRRSDCD